MTLGTSGVADQPDAANSPTTSPPPRVLFWVLAVAFVGLLGMGAAHTPERIKLLGPYAIALGLIAGGVLGRVGREFGISRGLGVLMAIAVLLLVTEVINTVEAHRLSVASALEQKMAPVSMEYTDEQLAAMSSKHREIVERGSFIDASHRKDSTFQQFLLVRMLAFPEAVHGWSKSRAVAFWIAELAGGVAAGVLMARWLLQSGKQEAA